MNEATRIHHRIPQAAAGISSSFRLASSEANEKEGSDLAADGGEDPFSPGPFPAHSRRGSTTAPLGAQVPHAADGPDADLLPPPLGPLAGGLIALLTMLVPLGSVVADRAGHQGTGTTAFPAAPPQRDGSPMPARLTLTGAGQPAGGDTGRQHR